MKKSKIFKSTIMLAALLPVSIISLASVSAIVPNQKEAEDDDYDFSIEDEDFHKEEEEEKIYTDEEKAAIRTQLADLLQKVSVQIENISDYTVFQGRDHNLITYSGFDDEVYGLLVTEEIANNDNQTLTIKFVIEDLKSKIFSEERTLLFTGFKKETSLEQLFIEESNKVKFDYPNKKSTLADTVKLENVIATGFNSELYDINIDHIEQTPWDHTWVWIWYSFTKKETGEKSNAFIKSLEGFQKSDEHKHAKTVEKAIENLKVDVKNKQNLETKNVKWTDIELSGYDENQVWVRIEKIEVVDDHKIKIEIRSWLNEDSPAFVSRTFEVNGINLKVAELKSAFSIQNQSSEKRDYVNEKIVDLKVHIENKETKVPSKITWNDLIFHDYDYENVWIRVDKLDADDENGTLKVEISSWLYEDSTEFVTKTLEIKGLFNEKAEVAKKTKLVEEKIKELKVYVHNKQDKLASSIKRQDLVFHYYDYENVWIRVDKIEADDSKGTLKVEISSWLYEDSTEFVTKTLEIDGFAIKNDVEVSEDRSYVTEQIKDIKISVGSKHRKFATTIIRDDLEITGYNEENVWIRIEKLEANDNTGTLKVLLSSWKYEDTTESVQKVIEITGFYKNSEDKTKLYNEKSNFVKGEIENIQIFVDNKQDKLASSVWPQDILVHNFDDERVWVNVYKVEANDKTGTLTVTLKSWLYEDSSDTVTKVLVLTGFKK